MAARNWVLAGVLALNLAPRLAAADYWKYESESGSVAFTDDAKNIPAKYQKEAVRVPVRGLEGYERLSVVDPIRTAPATPKGVAVEPAPDVYSLASAPAPAAQAGERVSLDVGGVRIDVDTDADSEPIYVDKEQYVDEDGRYIDHNGIMAPTTVIRRGDKVLAYIDER
jgi:hypothetical protein